MISYGDQLCVLIYTVDKTLWPTLALPVASHVSLVIADPDGVVDDAHRRDVDAFEFIAAQLRHWFEVTDEEVDFDDAK